MNDPNDYYRILHVHPDAPTEIIRSSYRTLMQRLKQHPDLGGDHDKAALINEAYATLADPIKRAEYDQGRRTLSSPPAGTAGKPPDSGSHPNATVARHTYRGLGLGYCGFCSSAHEHGGDPPEDALCDSCSSPLRRAERHAVSDPGVRALDRVEKQQDIRFYTDWPDSPVISGHTQDISLDGMRFETTQALAVNQMIKIDCDVCRAIARVAHVHQETGAWIVGVEFVTLRFEKSQGTFVSAKA